MQVEGFGEVLQKYQPEHDMLVLRDHVRSQRIGNEPGFGFKTEV